MRSGVREVDLLQQQPRPTQAHSNFGKALASPVHTIFNSLDFARYTAGSKQQAEATWMTKI